MLTQDETLQIMLILKNEYPEFEITPIRKMTWQHTIGRFPFHLVKQATFNVICRLKYTPHVHDIIEETTKLLCPDNYISPTDAWGLILTAIHRYGAYNEKTGVASLPPYIQSVVKCIGWRDMCLSENVDVLRGEFFKMYSNHQMRITQENTMLSAPQRLRELVDKTFSQN